MQQTSGNCWTLILATAAAISAIAANVVLNTRSAMADPLTTLYSSSSLNGNNTNQDGFSIESNVVADSHGNLYGTAYSGGVNGNGTIFEISPGITGGPVPGEATETTLYTFSASGTTDGSDPYSGLVWGKNGDLYGVTSHGGANGVGTIFQLASPTSGTPQFTAIYSLTGSIAYDPWFPPALGTDTDGALYCTGETGGAHNNGGVFKFDPVTQTLTDIYDFTGGNDGAHPESGLAIGPNGSLYGTASAGGLDGSGTVFQLTPNGSTYSFSVIYTFAGEADGAEPSGAVALGAGGSVYGTAQEDGTEGNRVLYRLTPDSHAATGFDFAALHEFGAYNGTPDGADPFGGLNIGPDGTLYGTCYDGGNGINNDNGTIFKYSQAGGFAVLHTFMDNATPPCVDGNGPSGTLTLVGNTLYGTTYYGGLNGFGTVFSLPSSNPPASILWENSVTGAVFLWNMDFGNGGYQIGSYQEVTDVADTSWRIAAAGDVTGSGVPDLIWQNSSTGDLYYWLMQDDPLMGYVAQTGSYYNYLETVIDTQWQVVGDGDLDGSGVPSLIWQNTATGQAYDWLMDENNGYELTSYSAITPTVGSNRYQIQAIADINQDNIPDLIWRDTVTGAIYLWYMGYDGNTGDYTQTSMVTVSTTVPAVWKIVGCADINGDGVPDLLFQNQQTGVIVYWLMAYNAGTGAYTLLSPTSYAVLTTLAPTWRVAGFGV